MIPSIANLRNVAALAGLVERVQNRTFGLPGMATFYGPSGWGKTTAVTVAANAYDAYVVQVKDCWTPTYFATAILREIGVEPVRGIAGMVDLIGAQLARTDRPLIIDDAQYLLRKRMIELTRDIYESSQATVILVGEEKLPQDLTRWENIHNRQLAWEAAQACNVIDAQKLAPIYCAGVEVEPELLKTIVDVSAGSIRHVSTNLAKVQEVARRAGTKIATVEMWGDRAWHTGLPPVRRQVADFRPVRANEPKPTRKAV